MTRAPVLAVALTLLGCLHGKAQTLDRAEINGAVRDETGAALAGVVVTLREMTTGFERTTVTERTGTYSAPLLPLGTYIVLAERTGFSPAASDPLPLHVGQALAVNFVMKIAGVTENVAVTAAPNTAPALGTVMNADALRRLPVNGRNYKDFALLSPTAQSIAGPRGVFRVAGQPGDYLALNVDGADATNNFFGELFGAIETPHFTIPLEAVQEFEVAAGGLGAQAGRSNGGLVNVVTKSGTNQRRGSLAYFLRHHSLTADDAFGRPPAGLVRHAGAGSLGGAFVPDRTFYFVAGDIQRQTTPLTVRFARSVSGVGVPELGIADLRALEGQYPRHEDVTAVLGKIDHVIGASHRLTVRSLLSSNRGDNIGGGSLATSRATSNLETFSNRGLSIVVGAASALGPRLLLDTRFHTSGETRPRSSQGIGPQVQIADTGTFGSALFLPASQDMFRYQVSEHAAYLVERHDVRAGVDYNGFNMRNNAFALGLHGAYTFPTLEAFLRRQPSLYAQNFGLNGSRAEDAALLRSVWQHELAAYVQDRFRPTPRLTIGLGIRYDAQLNPEPQAGTAGATVPVGLPIRDGDRVRLTYAPVPQGIPDDVNNWSPRADVAYQFPTEDATVVRGSAGLYYGRTPMIYFPLRGSGTTNTTLFLPPARFGVTFPEVLPSAIAPGSALAALLGPPAISYVDPGFANPRVFQANVSLTRRVAGVDLEPGFIVSRSRNLRIGGFRATQWDRNLAPPSRFDQFGRGIDLLATARPDPTIAQANALASFGRAAYRALTLTVRKPLQDRWQFYFNYTLAKSTGNASTERDTEAAFGPSDPFNLEADYGLNELDQRHQVKAYLVAALPYDVTVASTWSAGSGLAFPAYSPVDLNGDRVTNDGLHPDRPVIDGQLLPRFPYHQPAYFVWDVRVEKRLRVGTRGAASLMLEIFNALNNDNMSADPRTQAILGSPNFRVNNLTRGPRLAQLGLRFEF
jgi:hypothetical protein